MRRAETVLGVYDVMRLACVAFRLDVSREVARQWLEICGSADPSAVALKILSAPRLERFCGDFLRASGFGRHAKSRSLTFASFKEIFSHVDTTEAVLAAWARNRAAPEAEIPDVSEVR